MPLTLKCRDALKLLADQCQVTIVWVPGHMDIASNERADELIRKDSKYPFSGPGALHIGLNINNDLELELRASSSTVNHLALPDKIRALYQSVKRILHITQLTRPQTP